MERWKRPLLCLRCKCPAVDGGVRVSRAAAAKVSGWWRRILLAEMQPDDVIKRDVVCNFCIRDTLQQASSCAASDARPGQDTRNLHNLIRRCKVVLTPLSDLAVSSDPEVDILRGHPLRQKVVCIYCKNLYADNDSLRQHVMFKHSRVKIKCSIHGCSEYFLSRADLDEHFRLQHQAQEELKIYKCCECSYKASHKFMLNHHVAVRHGRRRLQCPKCTKVFKSAAVLLVHLKQTHMQQKFCEHCCAQIVHLKRHLRQQQCLKCGHVAPCLAHYAFHIRDCKKIASQNSNSEN